MKPLFLFLKAAMALLIAMAFSAQAQTDPNLSAVALPNDIRITPPGPEVKPEFARWSGVWSGVWESGPPNVLIVESVTSEGAHIIYAWGAYLNARNPNARVPTAGFNRIYATFNASGELVLPRNSPWWIDYRYDSQDTIKGSLMAGRIKSSIVLARTNLP